MFSTFCCLRRVNNTILLSLLYYGFPYVKRFTYEDSFRIQQQVEDTAQTIDNRYLMETRATEPVKGFKIAIIGSRKVRRAQILMNFFKGTAEGQKIIRNLLSAQKAKLIMKLVDSDACNPFHEEAISDCDIFIIVQEKNDHIHDPMAYISEIQQEKNEFPSQVFIVSNPKYNHNLTEVYPVLKGVKYSLSQYYNQMRVNAVSSDYSLSLHFLDEFRDEIFNIRKEDRARIIQNPFSRDIHAMGPATSVQIAIIGSRKLRRAQILLNFFKGTSEGQKIIISLLASQKAKMVLKLLDSDACRPFHEEAISDCDIFIIVQEKNDHKQDPMAYIRQLQKKTDGLPSQVFTVCNPKYNHNIEEVYPVLKGVQYSLSKYYHQIRVNAVSSDYSLSFHFLDEFCHDKDRGVSEGFLTCSGSPGRALMVSTSSSSDDDTSQ